MKSLVGIANLVAAFATVWLFHGRGGSRKPATVLSDGRIEFAPDPLIFPALLFLEVPVIWYCVRTLQHGFTFGLSLLPAIFVGGTALVHVISYPGTVVVTRDGLEQLHWFLPNKRMR